MFKNPYIDNLLQNVPSVEQNSNNSAEEHTGLTGIAMETEHDFTANQVTGGLSKVGKRFWTDVIKELNISDRTTEQKKE